MSTVKPVIVWFRQDLRLSDNPALDAAVDMDAPILPVYILDEENAADVRLGGASRWWLHESLTALNADLGDGLLCLAGNAVKVLPKVARNVGASAVFWNRCYEPWRIRRDKLIKTRLAKAGYKVRSFNASLLFEPPNVYKADGTPYKVFTPYYRRGCLEQAPPPRKPGGRATIPTLYREHGGESVDDLRLKPGIDWYSEMAREWRPGEAGGRERLDEFLADGLADYADGRNRPDKPWVSRLSPHLHFGEMSPHTAWHAVGALGDDDALADSVDTFRSELGWREFSYYLLYNWPTLPTENLQRKFDRFPWLSDDGALERWQRGATGVPIVDAGMRELWRTGYMHNRVRMIVGSFLVKNLMLDWRLGERWFWDTLLDADLANNSAGWQWIAGSGADAAPYFRVFNPVKQGERFDPDGVYVRRYVPEIERLPDKNIHAPWEAGDDVLESAKIELGRDYPKPIVDLKTSRERALEAFKSISASSG